jgi:hypothetical protein
LAVFPFLRQELANNTLIDKEKYETVRYPSQRKFTAEVDELIEKTRITIKSFMTNEKFAEL